MLRCGYAQVEITPPAGVPMAGYSARREPGRGTHDPLFARAVAWEDGGARAILVVADVLGWEQDSVERVRAGVEERTVVPAAAVLLAATHTHAGPAVVMRRYWPPDPAYLAEAEAGLVASAVAAWQDLRPVTGWCAGWGGTGIAVNRRDRVADPRVVLSFRTGGPVDASLQVVRFDRGPEPAVCLFTAAAHPTVLGADFVEFSAEYPGAAIRCLSRCVPGTHFVFLNGCCGDLAPRRRGGWDEVEAVAQTLADDTAWLLGRLRRADALPPLAVARVVRPLPVQCLPPAAAVEAAASGEGTWAALVREQRRRGAVAPDPVPADCQALARGRCRARPLARRGVQPDRGARQGRLSVRAHARGRVRQRLHRLRPHGRRVCPRGL